MAIPLRAALPSQVASRICPCGSGRPQLSHGRCRVCAGRAGAALRGADRKARATLLEEALTGTPSFSPASERTFHLVDLVASGLAADQAANRLEALAELLQDEARRLRDIAQRARKVLLTDLPLPVEDSP